MCSNDLNADMSTAAAAVAAAAGAGFWGHDVT
jgi:hypothetical protein